MIGRLAVGSLALALSLCSCSGSGNDPRRSGLEALQAGEHGRAADLLGKALEILDPGAPEYVEVAMGYCKALARVDGQECLEQFERLERGGLAGSADYSAIASDLGNAGQHAAALALVDRGLVRFPADETLIALRVEVQQEQQKPAVTEEARKIEELGYAGERD